MIEYQKTYIIAEVGVNHNGSLDRAKELIAVAAGAGADAVKFQTFKAANLVTGIAPKAEYQVNNTDSGESQYEMLKKLELSFGAHIELADHCRKCGIEFLSAPFDIESVRFLNEQLNIAKIKIPSGEITNAPLLLEVAYTGKPVILSTGMSTLGDIETALSVLAFGYTQRDTKPSLALFRKALLSAEGQAALRKKVSLLQCTTEYPTPFDEVNLKALETMKVAFGLPVGLSDHTEGIAVALAAVALGGAIVEKHFTLDKMLPGPDHKASLEPIELRTMIVSIRQIEKALGSTNKMPAETELKNMAIARKSLVALTKINKGEFFSEDNLGVKRPGDGISPMEYWKIIGKVATKDYQKDEKILL